MAIDGLSTLAVACKTCSVCWKPEKPYQTPPMLGIFPPMARIIVIAQNPGEIKASDEARKWWIDEFSNGHEVFCPMDLLQWYKWDFMTSHGYKMLSQVFGSNWLIVGDIAYTNAVRCRTRGNERPNDKVIKACAMYTRQIILAYSAIVLVGGVACNQVLNFPPKIGWGEIVTTKSGRMILPIMHYAAWRGKEDIENYAEKFAQMREAMRK